MSLFVCSSPELQTLASRGLPSNDVTTTLRYRSFRRHGPELPVWATCGAQDRAEIWAKSRQVQGVGGVKGEMQQGLCQMSLRRWRAERHLFYSKKQLARDRAAYGCRVQRAVECHPQSPPRPSCTSAASNTRPALAAATGTFMDAPASPRRTSARYGTCPLQHRAAPAPTP